MMPAIFLGVAAFLLNVVLSRLIAIAARADRHAQGVRLHGPRGRLHYASCVIAVAAFGALVGIGAGRSGSGAA